MVSFFGFFFALFACLSLSIFFSLLLQRLQFLEKSVDFKEGATLNHHCANFSYSRLKLMVRLCVIYL